MDFFSLELPGSSDDSNELSSPMMLQVSTQLQQSPSLIGVSRPDLVRTIDTMPPPIQGDVALYLMPEWATNALAALMAAAPVVCFLLRRKQHFVPGRCPPWVAAMLVSSYACWLLGFFVRNTSYWIAGMFFGTTQVLTRDLATKRPAVLSESPYMVIHTGVCFLIIAVGDPLLKLLLMTLGTTLSGRPSTVGAARRCLLTVRVISKWASPMYLFLLALHCQLLIMNVPPVLLTHTVLDIGWAGYTIFCVTNMISAVAIPMPEERDRASRPLPHWTGWTKHGFQGSVALAGLIYLVLLFWGLSVPTFTFQDPQIWGMSTATKAAINREVSLLDCMAALLQRVLHSWQVITFFAFLIFLILVLVVPVVDILALVTTVHHAVNGNRQLVRWSISVSRIARHCSGVDVLIVGTYLAQVAGFLYVGAGLQLLLVAEVIRYALTYLIVEMAVDVDDNEGERPKN